MEWLHLILDVPRDRWEGAVDFWAEAARAAASLPRREDDQFVTLLPASGSPWVSLRAIDEPNDQSNDPPDDPPAGVYLNLDIIDPAAAVERSIAAGAVLAWTHQHDAVLRSPGGMLFCHTLAPPDQPSRLGRGGTDVVLDQVCLDIPPRWWNIEVTFWHAVTGRDLERGLRPEFAFLGDREDPAGAPRILLQRLGTDAPIVSAHLDFATGDKQNQSRRHQTLGATVVADYPRWTVLRAPSGHCYCLTDRDPSTGSVHHSSTAT